MGVTTAGFSSTLADSLRFFAPGRRAGVSQILKLVGQALGQCMDGIHRPSSWRELKGCPTSLITVNSVASRGLYDPVFPGSPKSGNT